MATDRQPNPGRWLRPRHLFVLMSGLLLALGAGWGAASVAQAPAGAATPAVTAAPNAPRLTIDIGQLNDSGVTGTATLSEAGANQTIVAIAVKNVSGNHPAHIHAGTCDKFAPEPSYDLQNIDKNGKSTTLIKVSLTDLLAKPFVIDAHLSPNELGTLIMCGEIKGTPATPTASPTTTATATAPAATKPVATTPAVTKAPTATAAVATTPPATATATAVATTPSATATATAAIAPTGTGGKQAVTPATTPASTTPAAALVTPVTSGKGIPTANGGVGGDGTGGSTVSAVASTGSAASTASMAGDDSLTATTGSAAATDTGGQTAEMLPKSTGAGTSIPRPQTTAEAISWALGFFALLIGGCALLIRRRETAGPHRSSSRWLRLGL